MSKHDLDQVMLPYMKGDDGRTMYELALGPGSLQPISGRGIGRRNDDQG